MPNETLIHSNDAENGYIYKELNNRIARLENTVEQLYNIIQLLNTSGISIEQLTSLVSDVQAKATTEYVQNHVEDSNRHLNDIKILEWDNKYEKPVGGIPITDLSLDIQNKLNSI